MVDAGALKALVLLDVGVRVPLPARIFFALVRPYLNGFVTHE